MDKIRESYIKIIEFYLKNLPLINRELEYRIQLKDTNSLITVNKLYKPIPFDELYSISGSINRTLKSFDGEKSEFVRLRYGRGCTFDVICGLLNVKRSTLYSLSNQILDEFLFNIMLDTNARDKIIGSNIRSYVLC